MKSVVPISLGAYKSLEEGDESGQETTRAQSSDGRLDEDLGRIFHKHLAAEKDGRYDVQGSIDREHPAMISDTIVLRVSHEPNPTNEWGKLTGRHSASDR